MGLSRNELARLKHSIYWGMSDEKKLYHALREAKAEIKKLKEERATLRKRISDLEEIYEQSDAQRTLDEIRELLRQ